MNSDIAVTRATTSGTRPAPPPMRATQMRNHPTTSPAAVATASVRRMCSRVQPPAPPALHDRSGRHSGASATPVHASGEGRSPISTPNSTGTVSPITQNTGEATITGPSASER